MELKLVPDFYCDENVVVFGVDNSSSVHIDNRKKDISVLGKGPTQGLENATITTEAKYSINFSRSKRKLCQVCIIMETIAFRLLMTQKFINSKEKILK